MEKDTKILHLKYWVGILVGILILSIAYQFGYNKNLLEQISFASALASIALAIVAILYAIITNSSLDKSLIKIRESADSILLSSNNIANTSIELSNEISELEKKVDYFPNGVNTIMEKLDYMGQINKVSESTTKPTMKVKEFIESPDYIDYFIRIMPPADIFVLYFVCLSKETNKIIVFNDLFKGEEEAIKVYFPAMIHLALFKFFDIKNLKNFIVEIDAINPYLDKENIKKMLMKITVQFPKIALLIPRVENYFLN